MTTAPPVSRARQAASGVAVLAAVPYLVLKVHWLTGGTLGLRGLEPSATLDTLNVFTAGLDVVAVGLAATFAFRWGLRVPAALVLLPIWVGTGLLAPMLLGTPLSILATVASEGAVVADTPDLPVEPWVYLVVYAGFALQGVGLLTAFWLYARQRWPEVLRGSVGTPPAGPGRSPLRAVLDPLAHGGAAAAAGLALLYLLWAAGSAAGLAAERAAQRGLPGQVQDVVLALPVLAAVLGLLMLVRGWGAGWPRWLAVLLAWTGTGAMFAWGMWTTLLALLGGAGLGQASEPDLTDVVALVRFALGIVLGVALLLAVAERQAGEVSGAPGTSAGTA